MRPKRSHFERQRHGCFLRWRPLNPEQHGFPAPCLEALLWFHWYDEIERWIAPIPEFGSYFPMDSTGDPILGVARNRSKSLAVVCGDANRSLKRNGMDERLGRGSNDTQNYIGDLFDQASTSQLDLSFLP